MSNSTATLMGKRGEKSKFTQVKYFFIYFLIFQRKIIIYFERQVNII